MKTTRLRQAVWFFPVFIFLASLHAQAQSDTSWNAKKASAWVAKKIWLNGLKQKPYSDLNNLEFARQYQAHKAWWDKAFAFMRDSDLNKIRPGNYVIDGDNVIASVTERPSKEFKETKWESHRKYIDVQYVIRGKEKIGLATIPVLTVTDPFDASKDVAHYSGDGKYFIADPDTFFIFFSTDPHRPSIKVDGYDVVKKITIKVKSR